MKRNLFQLLFSALVLLSMSLSQVLAFDASPFNTQSAELSNGGWWTLYSETLFNRRDKLITPLYGELRYTFFDKLRLGVLGSLSYASDGDNSAFGLSNLILTTEYELYDFEKYDFLKYGSFEPIDHANFFLNQFIPIAHDDKLGSNDYAFNLGIEWQKQLNSFMGFYSELGYLYSPELFGINISDHNFMYNNSVSFEIHHWIQPYIELLGVTNLSSSKTQLLLAPGISLDYNDQIFFYANPIFSLNNTQDWGFQLGVTGNI